MDRSLQLIKAYQLSQPELERKLQYKYINTIANTIHGVYMALSLVFMKYDAVNT